MSGGRLHRLVTKHTPCRAVSSVTGSGGASRVSRAPSATLSLLPWPLHLPECGPGHSGTSARPRAAQAQGARVHRRLPVTVEGCLQLKGSTRGSPALPPQGEAGVLPLSPAHIRCRRGRRSRSGFNSASGKELLACVGSLLEVIPVF